MSFIGLHMLAFLVEVLEKGMQQVQVPVLNIIHCMLHYIDLSSPHAQPISSDLIRVIAKYLDVSLIAIIVVIQITICIVKSEFFPFTEHILEGCVENFKISCNKKFNVTSCATGFTRWNITSLLWKFQ